MQNRSIANLACGPIEKVTSAKRLAFIIMVSALPFFRNEGQYFEGRDVVCLLLEKYFGRYEFVH